MNTRSPDRLVRLIDTGQRDDYGVVINSYSTWTLPLKVIWPL